MSAEMTQESDRSMTAFPVGQTCVLRAKSRNTAGSGFSCSALLLHFVGQRLIPDVP